MKYSDRETVYIVEQIGKQLHDLTEWEQGFYATVKNTLDAGRKLTGKQAERLSKIWDKLEDM